MLILQPFRLPTVRGLPDYSGDIGQPGMTDFFKMTEVTIRAASEDAGGMEARKAFKELIPEGR